MSEIVVGLDIGTTKIACFVGRKNEHGKIEILSMGKTESLGVTRGVVSNIEKTVQSIKTAVAEAQERVDGELTIGLVNFCVDVPVFANQFINFSVLHFI